MSLPTLQVLGVRRLVEGARDDHGNAIKSHGPEQPWPVHGYAPGANTEPTGDGNRDQSLIEWTVYAPADDPTDPKAPSEHDLVVVAGVDYAVNGRPADWTHGPWAHPNAGLVVELIRAEG